MSKQKLLEYFSKKYEVSFTNNKNVRISSIVKENVKFRLVLLQFIRLGKRGIRRKRKTLYIIKLLEHQLQSLDNL